MNSFHDFIASIIVENLHPELQSIVSSKSDHRNKMPQMALKVKDLTSRGEKTGIEGNMPKGSSRAYLGLADKHPMEIDGHHTSMRTGIKVAIKSPMDRHHDASAHDGMSLGHLQNEAEGGDHWVNRSYRTLTHEEGNKYSSNEGGIFPPLVDHDHETHEWSHVGHVDDVSGIGFRKHTKCESHPMGITHKDFCATLTRRWDADKGKHWKKSPEEEAKMDHVEQHPLVQSFLDHQGNTATPPHDYAQLKNMGVWTHPVTGKGHIVARDHGFSKNVMDAYHNARMKMGARHSANDMNRF